MCEINKEQKIDVIIPVYNGERFVLEAIKSVEQQTLKPNKIIIVNDGSTDGTESLIKNYPINPNITLLYVSKENAGPNSARNVGIQKSTAPFITFLDADDIWEPEKLERQVVAYKSSPFAHVGLVYCRYGIIDRDGRGVEAKVITIDRQLRGNAYEKVLSANKILGSASSVLIPREVFGTVGMFDESLRFGEDWDMWIRIAKQYEIDYVDEVLVQIRRHEGNATANDTKAFAGEIPFYKKWIPLVSKVPETWPDRLIFKVIKKLPSTTYSKLLKAGLPKQSYYTLFSKTAGSAFLYTLWFFIKYTIKKI